MTTDSKMCDVNEIKAKMALIEIDRLRNLVDKQNKDIKKLNNKNTKLIKEVAKLNSFNEESQSKVFEANKKYAWGIILGHIVFKVFEISIAKIL